MPLFNLGGAADKRFSLGVAWHAQLLTSRHGSKTAPLNMNEEKKVTFADTDRIDEHAQIAGEVMHVLLGLQPGEYFISDDSHLYDFIGVDENEPDAMNELWNKIQEAFGVSQEDVKSSNLADIFAAVAHRRNLQ